MSPTPTSTQSTSWHKHSVRPGSINGSRLTEPPVPLLSSATSASVHKTSKSNHLATSETETNFRPAHISQIEDSYWRPSEPRKEQLHPSDITPSPSRHQHQQFYTAKQFGPASSGSAPVESLRVASPDLRQSPSVRPGARLAGVDLPSTASWNEQNSWGSVDDDPSLRDTSLRENGLTMGNRSDWATQGDVTRLSRTSESELSRIDSQATSLQRAISSALTSDPHRTSDNTTGKLEVLPLEDAIVARYRQSRTDRSHNSIAAYNAHHLGDVDAPNLLPKESVEQITEPLKHASPLLGRHTPSGLRLSAQAEDLQVPTSQNHSAMARSDCDEGNTRRDNAVEANALLAMLEKVTAECSRRGDLIDTLVAKVGASTQPPTQMHIQEVLESDQKTRALEAKLSQYQLQMDQMYDTLIELQLSTGQNPVTVPEDPPTASRSERTTVPPVQSPFERTTGAIPVPQFLHVDHQSSCTKEDVEESYQDKIDRWNHHDDCAIAQNSNPQTDSDPLARAKAMLSETPAMLQTSFNSTSRCEVSKETANNKARASGSSREAVRPAETSVKERSIYEDSRARANQSGELDRLDLLEKLERATAEIEQLKRLNNDQRHPNSVNRSKESTVRPLTPDMMSDARDNRVCPEDKTYTRLRLAEIDSLTRNETGNLLKNILIQLDVPFANLSSSITALGARLTSNDEQVHGDLIREALKLREFAENIHATLYAGAHIEGAVTSRRCLNDMHVRIGKMQRAIARRQSCR